jgi:capsular polysaccharide biosynthesis protein
MLIIFGAITGLIVGVAVAFARDFLDPSIKSSIQAYRMSQVPIIAEIPFR